MKAGERKGGWMRKIRECYPFPHPSHCYTHFFHYALRPKRDLSIHLYLAAIDTAALARFSGSKLGVYAARTVFAPTG